MAESLTVYEEGERFATLAPGGRARTFTIRDGVPVDDADPAPPLTDAQVARVRAFVQQRGEYVTACRNSGGDDADYHRWLGHADARRQLAVDLGWPVPGGWL